MTTATPRFFAERKRIVELAGKYRLPAIYPQKEFVDEGGLMSYGADYADLYRRAAVYVDKILKGAKPADLPVQQATKFEFVINLKAAKQIGLTIPVRRARAGESGDQVRRGECQVSRGRLDRGSEKDMKNKISLLTLCARALCALPLRSGAAAGEGPQDRRAASRFTAEASQRHFSRDCAILAMSKARTSSSSIAMPKEKLTGSPILRRS